MKRSDDSYIYTWRTPTTDEFDNNRLVDIGKNKQRRLVRGASKGIVAIKNLDEHSSKLTWIQQGDQKGNVPRKIMETQIHRTLHLVFQVREKFNRDDEVDTMERLELMEIMRSVYQDEVYDSDKTSLIDSIRSRMTAVPNDSFRPLPSPDFRTKMSIAHVEGESTSIIKCEVIIDASLEEVAAYGFIYMSRKRGKINNTKNTLVRDATNTNNHALEIIYMKELGFG